MSDAPLVLAFDTSAAHCAAACVQGGRVLSRRVEEMARGQAERLPALIEETLAEAGARTSDVARMGVGVGPGNFTGVRIAVALARGLALSLGRPAIGVTRFEALLDEAPRGSGRAVVAVATRRGQLAAQAFGAQGAALDAPRADDADALAMALRRFSPELVIGAGEALAAALGVAHRPGALPEGDRPDPAAIAAVAARAGPDAPRPAPLYLRPADAAPPSEAPPPLLA